MKQRISKYKYLILALVVCAVLGTVLLFGVFLPEDACIGGKPVGGKNPYQVWTELRAEEKALRQQELTISLPQRDITLSPKVRFHKCKAIFSAFQNPSVPLSVSYSKETVLSLLETYTANFDTDFSPSGYRLLGETPNLSTRDFDGKTQELYLDPGVPERRLDTEAVLAALDEMYSQIFAREDYRIRVDVPALTTPEPLDLDAICEELCSDPVNDSLDMDTYEVIPGSYGYGFDLEEAKQALAQTEYAVSIPMVATAPEIMGEAVYFQDELGHCETKHTDDENRNTNLRLVCKALDGLIIQPGEEFSYNGTVGERTEEKGYKPAGAYSGNRLVKDIGGGVCQGSTTLYNCVLLADLEVIERNGHGFTVNYVPIGLDAAVNWATKTDLRFRNNWHFPIQIRAEVSDGYMRMKILGTDEKDYYIQMTSTRGDTDLRIYSNSYKNKYDKQTGAFLSKELEARSSYMYME